MVVSIFVNPCSSRARISTPTRAPDADLDMLRDEGVGSHSHLRYRRCTRRDPYLGAARATGRRTRRRCPPNAFRRNADRRPAGTRSSAPIGPSSAKDYQQLVLIARWSGTSTSTSGSWSPHRPRIRRPGDVVAQPLSQPPRARAGYRALSSALLAGAVCVTGGVPAVLDAAGRCSTRFRPSAPTTWSCVGVGWSPRRRRAGPASGRRPVGPHPPAGQHRHRSSGRGGRSTPSG